MKEVVNSYVDSGNPKKVQSSGFYIAGQRYVTIKAEDRSLYGKQVFSDHRLQKHFDCWSETFDRERKALW